MLKKSARSMSSDSVRGMGTYHPLRGFASPVGSAAVILRSPEPPTRPEIQVRAARALLNRFYDAALTPESRSWHERRLNLTEMFPVTREDFLEMGRKRLIGKKAGQAWFDAWWTVRMGLPQTRSFEHQLTLTSLHLEQDGELSAFGHFCFGLRRKGGDAENDLNFDFRAPWYEDRQPRETEGLNIHNVLILEGYGINLYDWLYTQTSYRSCEVHLWFLPASKEQIVMLRHFHESVGLHDAGYFRVFRKNCASLGLAFLDRLGPLSEPISLGKGIADIPVKKVDKVLEAYGEVPHYILENVTDKLGREPTAKSKMHQAQPTRGTSRPFRLLQTVKGAN